MTDDGIKVRNSLPFAMTPEWLLDMPVSSNALRLYAILARYADRDQHAHPSRRTLAERCFVSIKTVDRSLKELVMAGALLVENRHDEHGDLTSNDYILTPGRDTSDATPGHQSPNGRDTSDATVGTPVTHELEPTEREPTEREKNMLPRPFFDEFWTVYPRREGKAAALKAWQKALPKADLQVILDGARRYRDDPNREDAYTAHASTWLNQERWDDPPLPSRVTRKPDAAAELLREALRG